MSRDKKWTALITCNLVLLLLLVACGGGGGSADTAAPIPDQGGVVSGGIPAATTPAPATPGATTPAATTPGATTPGTTTPGTTTPGTTTPGATTPGTTTPGTTTPGTTTPGTTTPGTATPGTATPGTATPAATTPVTSTPTAVVPPTPIIVVAVASCKEGLTQSFAGDIDKTPAGNGGDGGTGTGDGGAAAGGGLGKVLGGKITVTDLSNGSIVGSALTDRVNGLVTVKTCARVGPFLLTLEGQLGATYYDEGVNAMVPFGAENVLHALVDKWDEHVGVSPITEAAYRYALNNIKGNPIAIAAGNAPLRVTGDLTGLTIAQVVQANSLVLGKMNEQFTTNYQIPSIKTLPKPIDANSASNALTNTRYGRSAAMNGGIVKAAGFYNSGLAKPALTYTAQLAKDLTDGKIDGFALDGSAVTTSVESTYDNNRVALASEIGANAFAGQFGQALRPSVSQIDELAVNMPLRAPSRGPSCTYYEEDIALLSDGSISVSRVDQLGVSSAVQYNGVDWYLCVTGSPALLKNFLTNVKQVVSVDGAAYAVKRDGTVWAWGRNFCGTVNPASTTETYYTYPILVSGVSNITQIVAYDGQVYARDLAGRVFQWGVSERRGVLPGSTSIPVPQIGQSLCENSNVPTGPFGVLRSVLFSFNAPKLMTEVSNISKLVANKNGAFFAITPQGAVYAWGNGENGVLANGTTIAIRGPESYDLNNISLLGNLLAITQTYVVSVPSMNVINPALIPNLIGVKDIVASADMTYALMRDGSIKAWGSDASRHVGNGISDSKLRPTTVAGVENIQTLRLSRIGLSDDLVLLNYEDRILTWTGYSVFNLDRYYREPYFRATSVRTIETNLSFPFDLFFYMHDGRIRRFSTSSRLFYDVDNNAVFRLN
jgi:alpha-tubulin suppressor-like RCC1 family protein